MNIETATRTIRRLRRSLEIGSLVDHLIAAAGSRARKKAEAAARRRSLLCTSAAALEALADSPLLAPELAPVAEAGLRAALALAQTLESGEAP